MRFSRPLIMMLAAFAVVHITGCSTAASMRVEVDVYKGPLARTRQSQVGELNGTIQTATASLVSWRTKNPKTESTDVVQSISDDLSRHVCKELEKMALSYLTNLLAPGAALTANVALASAAGGFSNLTKDEDRKIWLSNEANYKALAAALAAAPPASTARETLDVLKKAKVACSDVFLDSTTRELDNDAVRTFTASVASVATRMTALATSITTSQLLSYSRRNERQALVHLAVILGESANQLAVRADVLAKQVAVPGADSSRAASRLGTSDYLRDASPTEFLGLISLLDATNVDGRDDWRSTEALNDTGRVNLAKQLFADQYWTRINDVYSSGQGDVRMALIKDDIGNWSQKSFDNDPTELLDAYRNVGLAALKTLTRVAKGTTVENLQTVSDLATNRFGSTQAAAEVSVDLKREREQTLTRLREIQKKAAALEDKYQEKSVSLLAALDAAAKAATRDSGVADAKRKDRDVEVQKYLDAVDKPETQAVIDNQRAIAVAAQNAYAAAAATALTSQEAATKAKADLESVQKPYKEGMRAALDEASTELDSLSRVANALQESRSPKPVAALPAAPAVPAN